MDGVFVVDGNGDSDSDIKDETCCIVCCVFGCVFGCFGARLTVISDLIIIHLYRICNSHSSQLQQRQQPNPMSDMSTTSTSSSLHHGTNTGTTKYGNPTGRKPSVAERIGLSHPSTSTTTSTSTSHHASR